MNCERFLSLLHFRDELEPAVREAFESHSGCCPACRRTLRETECVDDLLLSWAVPAPTRSIAEEVTRVLQGEGEEATCEQTAAAIHDLASREVYPWRQRRLDLHISRCHPCAEQAAEAQELRRTWQSWKVPDPSPGLTERIAAALRSEHDPDSRRGVLRRILLSDMRIPRLAAALLVLTTLLSLGTVWKLRQGNGGSPALESRPGPAVAAPTRTVRRSAPTLRTVGIYGTEAGRFDVSDSFSRAYSPARGRLLRLARRR